MRVKIAFLSPSCDAVTQSVPHARERLALRNPNQPSQIRFPACSPIVVSGSGVRVLVTMQTYFWTLFKGSRSAR